VLANPLTRTYAVKVALTNDDGALRIGMVAEVRLRQEGAAPAVVVPPAALRLDETGHTSVWIVQGDGRLRRQTVEVSGFSGEGTAIASGLAPGARVVTSGSPMLAEGVAVTVVDDKATDVARR
jgi:multidrug efflux pump subunit AcrA (membrane-fusion protein)